MVIDINQVMRIMKIYYLLFIFLLMSCTGDNNTFMGFYSLSDKSACSKDLAIKLNGNDFVFLEKAQENDLSTQLAHGHFTINRMDDKTYLKMNEIEGMYQDDAIIIQNYGNAMNKYSYFDSCDAKYLYFKKQ